MSKTILDRYQDAQILAQEFCTKKIVINDAVYPSWANDTKIFIYVRNNRLGKEFRIVDAELATNTLAFDHEMLARLLSLENGGVDVDAKDLPITEVCIETNPLRFCFEAFDYYWEFNAKIKSCNSQGPVKPKNFFAASEAGELLSPDGDKIAFFRDFNLWVRDVSTGDERALTTDGTRVFGYGGDILPGGDFSVRARWSPDSLYLFTFQLDLQEVREHPEINLFRDKSTDVVESPRIALPGDDKIESLRMVVVSVSDGNQLAIDYPKIPNMITSEIGCHFFSFNLGWWSSDGKFAYFVDISRGSQSIKVVELDIKTGCTRVLLEEISETFVKLRSDVTTFPLMLPLPETDELVWFSESTGNGHLYLYDIKTGMLKNSITKGQGWVRDIIHYSSGRRELLIQTAGRNPKTNPYYRDICRVNIDSGELFPITTENFEHTVYLPDWICLPAKVSFGVASSNTSGVSPCGDYIVTTRARVDTLPESVLLDRNGREILVVETADVSGLPDDYHWPESVQMKAADGRTDIFGVMYRPTGFSPDNTYPVVEYSCSSRMYSCTPHSGFSNNLALGFFSHLANALSALGFIVLIIDGRGTPLRDKAFQDYQFGKPAAANAIEDRMAGIRQLAKRYEFMDLNRIGMVETESTSTGIYGLLHHSDFYKVGVEHCLAEDTYMFASLSETYNFVLDPAGDFNNLSFKESIANGDLSSFDGKLLLVQGMFSILGVGSTFSLVQALQNANKNVDMLCLQSRNGMPSYATRREWDYLVSHLHGIEPPDDFKLTTGMDKIGL